MNSVAFESISSRTSDEESIPVGSGKLAYFSGNSSFKVRSATARAIGLSESSHPCESGLLGFAHSSAIVCNSFCEILTITYHGTALRRFGSNETLTLSQNLCVFCQGFEENAGSTTKFGKFARCLSQDSRFPKGIVALRGRVGSGSSDDDMVQ